MTVDAAPTPVAGSDLETPASFGVGRRRWMVVALGAAASLVLYVALLGVVQDLAPAEPSYAGEVFPWVGLHPGESERDAAEGPARYTDLRFLGILLALFTIYGLMLRAVAGRRSSALVATCFGAGAVFLAVQVVSPTTLSSDLFAYVVYGRILALYRGDPYGEVPALDPGDPYLSLLNASYTPSFYGPLWTLLSGGLAALGGEQIGLTVLLFRGAAILATLASAALIWSCLRRVEPGRAAQGVVFFLWNPLVVLEAGLSGHNDVTMVALLLFGIWLHVRGRPALAVAALTLSALVKFVTVLVLPLYVLLILRQTASWRERGRFLGMSAAGVALALAVVLIAAQAGPRVLAVGALGSGVERYTNSVHELLFRELRLWLGEEPESVDIPVWFRGWWVAGAAPTELRSGPAPSAESLERVEPGANVLVLAPQKSDWVRVYDPRSGRTGYVDGAAVVVTERPAVADSDPVAARLEAGPSASPTVARANAALRLLSWVAFGALWLLAAWRTRDPRGFLVWSAVVMLAACWLLGAWIWPWYAVWPLALAALVPNSRPATLAALLSATVLTLYVSIGYQGSDQEWVNTYRSLPAFVLPLVVFLLIRVAHPLASLVRAGGTPPTPDPIGGHGGVRRAP